MVACSKAVISLILGLFVESSKSMSRSSSSEELQIDERIHTCSAKLTRAKSYIVDSSDVRHPWYSSTCSLYIQAPPKHVIRISVTQLSVGCDINRLKVVDGWIIFDWFNGAHKYVPLGLASEPGRLTNLCENSSEASRTVLSSQNFAHILYKLNRSAHESFMFSLEFIPVNSACDNMVDSSVGAELTLKTSDKPGSCRIYISGPSQLTLRSMQLAEETRLCQTGHPSSIVVHSGNQGWSEHLPKIKHCQRRSCGQSIMAACSNSILELKSSCFESEFVTVSVRRPDDAELDPWALFCE